MRLCELLQAYRYYCAARGYYLPLSKTTVQLFLLAA